MRKRKNPVFLNLFWTKNKRSRDLGLILRKLVNDQEPKREVSYAEILEAFGGQAFGIAILFFALPSALPFSIIPGVSLIFSIPILFFAFQMIMGRKTLWLPKALADRTVHQETIAKFLHASQPWLLKIEYLLKPRLTFMTNRFMEILNGCVILCLALLLTLPIPFSNFILGGILIIFALGLTEGDGFFLIIAHIAALVYMGLMYVMILSAVNLLF